jgi:hypothetical protein
MKPSGIINSYIEILNNRLESETSVTQQNIIKANLNYANRILLLEIAEEQRIMDGLALIGKNIKSKNPNPPDPEYRRYEEPTENQRIINANPIFVGMDLSERDDRIGTTKYQFMDGKVKILRTDEVRR